MRLHCPSGELEVGLEAQGGHFAPYCSNWLQLVSLEQRLCRPLQDGYLSRSILERTLTGLANLHISHALCLPCIRVCNHAHES